MRPRGPSCPRCMRSGAGRLAEAPEALARRVLRRWFWEGAALRGPLPDERALGHGDTLALTALARGAAGEERNLPCGLKVVAGRDYLYLLTQEGGPLRPAAGGQPLPVTEGERTYALGFMRLTQTPGRAGYPRARPCGRGGAAPGGAGAGARLAPSPSRDRIRPMEHRGRRPFAAS